MRRFFYLLIPVLVIAVIVSALPFYNSCKELYDDVLRLHIIADSDSAADQSLKLSVRDRVIRECAGFYKDCGSKASAMEITAAHLREIERAAESEVRAHGFDHSVSAELDKAYFNTRYYDEFTMPAGWYDALRIRIGSGGGSNWWCVVYPSLCLGAACRDEAEEKLSDGEYRVVTSDKLDFRFKLVEYFEGFLNRFR